MMQRKEILIYKGFDSKYLFRFFPTDEDIIKVLQQVREMATDPELDFTFRDFETVCTVMLAIKQCPTSSGISPY